MSLRILHLIDSLEAGGSERVAVNLANELSKRGHQIFLCSTRREGPLKSEISPKVNFLYLQRRSCFDLIAIWKAIQFVRVNKIEIIHAHSSSIFFATILKFFLSKPKLIWHDHYGAYTLKGRPYLLYRLLILNSSGVLAVNKSLADWAKQMLGVPSNKVWRLPNFVDDREPSPIIDLPGQAGYRILCVANLRPQKDHITLVRAMQIVVNYEPRAHLILVGSDNHDNYGESVYAEIKSLGLEDNITWLGPRKDARNIMASCDIGVLSSVSEGLPLALLEYGIAGLSVVVTDVGDCSSVVDAGRAGKLVSPQSPEDLARAIIELLSNSLLRIEMSQKFSLRVKTKYSPDVILDQLENIYFSLFLEDGPPFLPGKVVQNRRE